MRPTTSLHIPQPCHESWAAMSPTATGRHCAACAKTVVDFTLATDAEILAYLARAAGGRTCGRFAAGQLERPLQRAAPAAPTARWRAWLAAALAVWGLREGLASGATAQAATEWRARYWGGPVPARPVVETVPLMEVTPVTELILPPVEQEILYGTPVIQTHPEHLDSLIALPQVLRGKITDSTDNLGIPGVTVLIKGTDIGVSTTAGGDFELTVPSALGRAHPVILTVLYVGYATQERLLNPQELVVPQNFQLHTSYTMLGEVVILPRKLPPAPWHPQAFYRWGKYWLARPFRRF